MGINIRKSCVLKIADILVYAVSVAGSNEPWSLYVLKNGTDATLISTLSVSSNRRVFSNINLNISFVNGDYFEIKYTSPNWATNPTNVIIGGYLYFELT
jgi:hypothetical protein